MIEISEFTIGVICVLAVAYLFLLLLAFAVVDSSARARRADTLVEDAAAAIAAAERSARRGKGVAVEAPLWRRLTRGRPE